MKEGQSTVTKAHQLRVYIVKKAGEKRIFQNEQGTSSGRTPRDFPPTLKKRSIQAWGRAQTPDLDEGGGERRNRLGKTMQSKDSIDRGGTRRKSLGDKQDRPGKRGENFFHYQAERLQGKKKECYWRKIVSQGESDFPGKGECPISPEGSLVPYGNARGNSVFGKNKRDFQQCIIK